LISLGQGCYQRETRQREHCVMHNQGREVFLRRRCERTRGMYLKLDTPDMKFQEGSESSSLECG
jgi:hypothetical protein